MAGLTNSGFEVKTLVVIKETIEQRLEQYNPGFDLSPESPDGQQVGIFSALLSEVWKELGRVYGTYDPNVATGAALKNLALLTGVAYQTATRSAASVTLVGTAGTLIPKGSLISSVEGFVFYTHEDATIPSSVAVLASKLGAVPVDANSIVILDSSIQGWDSVTQATAGTIGTAAQDEAAFRNLRNRTVLRNSTTSLDAIKGKLFEAGVPQVLISDNDANNGPLADGTPERHIHVLIGETQLSDNDVVQLIYDNKGLGTQTFGAVTLPVLDTLGNTHQVSFTKATAVPITIDVNLTFLSTDIAGADLAIKQDLAAHINQLLVGEDVIWSRLFQFVTAYGEAQVNTIVLSREVATVLTPFPINVPITDVEFTTCDVANINIIVQ